MINGQWAGDGTFHVVEKMKMLLEENLLNTGLINRGLVESGVYEQEFVAPQLGEVPESILNEARSRLAGNIVGIDIGKVFSGAKIQCLKYDAPYQHTGGQYVSSTVRNAVEKYELQTLPQRAKRCVNLLHKLSILLR